MVKIKYSIEEIKRVGKPKVPLSSFLIYNPISTRLAWAIVNFTRISPNQITCLGILLGVSSAYCFFQGIPPYLILGALLFGLSLILDWTDGKIARIKKEESVIGKFLDGSFDQFSIALNIFAIAYGQFKIENQSDFLLFAVAIILAWVVIHSFGRRRGMAEDFYIKKRQKLTPEQIRQLTETDKYNFLGEIKEIKDYFERKRLTPLFSSFEVATLVVIIGPIFNIIKECLILSLLLSVLMFILYLVVNIVYLLRLSST